MLLSSFKLVLRVVFFLVFVFFKVFWRPQGRAVSQESGFRSSLSREGRNLFKKISILHFITWFGWRRVPSISESTLKSLSSWILMCISLINKPTGLTALHTVSVLLFDGNGQTLSSADLPEVIKVYSRAVTVRALSWSPVASRGVNTSSSGSHYCERRAGRRPRDEPSAVFMNQRCRYNETEEMDHYGASSGVCGVWVGVWRPVWQQCGVVSRPPDRQRWLVKCL